MPDEPTTPPAPATGTPGSLPATGTPSTPSQGVTPAKIVEELQAKIAELERHSKNKEEEAARHGKNFTAAEKELAAYKEKDRLANEAALSDVQKATNRATELEALNQQYKQELINAKVRLAAQSKGIIDPDLAAMAIQKDLELGDDGMPTNVDKALDDLIKNKPYLAPKSAEPTQEQTTPAQTASQQRPPTTPVGNPGRSSIPSPNHQQLTPGRKVTFNEAYGPRPGRTF